MFKSKETHASTTDMLKSRFDNAVTIPGTLDYHSFVPQKDNSMQLKKFSSATETYYFPKTIEKKQKKKPQKKKCESENN